MLEPLMQFRSVKGMVQNRLKYNSNKYFNDLPIEVSRDAFDELRQLSCDLEEKYQSIALKMVFVVFGIVPKKQELSEVARNLIFISNSSDVESNDEKHKAFENIKKVLRIL